MSPRAIWSLAAGSAVFLAIGATLSHKIEPGILVERVTLAGEIPALRHVPAQPGPHPLALLGHGAFCCKEMFFRYGEALAHAGFECLAIDFPGHGDRMIYFTEKGRKRAEDIIRRHRLAERLFVYTFRVQDEHEIAEQACRFEHILSPEATDSICSFLGHPRTCPHGSPIPAGECCIRGKHSSTTAAHDSENTGVTATDRK